MGGGLEGIPLGSLGPSPVISRDDGGPVLAAAAPPVAGGNPFSLDMSSQAARASGPYLRSGRGTRANAELQQRDDGDGRLGRGLPSPLIPVTLEGQPIGLPALERSVSVELLLQLLLSC